MKKYIVSILVASVFLLGAPFLAPKASAADLNIRDFINLLVAIGVITPEKMPAVNAYLLALDSSNSNPITPVRACVVEGGTVTGSVSPAYATACCSGLVAQYPTAQYPNAVVPGASGVCVRPNSQQPSITILSPDGGETYKKESKITVNWQTKNVPSSFKFDVIRLRDYFNGGEYNLATNVKNDGQEIIVLKNIPEGAYTLEMKAYLDNVLVMDSSDSYFKVVSVNPEPQLITESIKCVFKNNDSNLIQSCYTQNKDGKKYTFSGTDTTGGEVTGYQNERMTWKSSCGGYDYSIMDGNNDYAYFNCQSTQPSITILSPNGGETYSVGETMRIKWGTENLGSLDVELDLIDKGGNVVRDIVGPMYDKGSYSWFIPKDIIPQGTTGAFRIMISSVDKGPSAQDFSDSYFKIVSIIQPTATILTSSRITATSPYIIGTASGVNQIGIVLSSESGDKVYGSGMIPVVNGKWSVTVTPALPLGNYTIYVFDADNDKLTSKSLSIVSSI